MKILLIAAMLLVTRASVLAEEKEFWCQNLKSDVYQPVYPGDRDDCHDAGGKFGDFDLKKARFSCMFTDSFFVYGMSYTDKKAKADCLEKSGTFKIRNNPQR